VLVLHHILSVVFLRTTVSIRFSVPPSSSHKCLRFDIWSTLCTIKYFIYLLSVPCNFSTETSFLFTTNNFFHSSDSGKSTLLISLDLSAAFDTIDHSTLLNRLNTNFGFTLTALSGLESYLTGRYQLVCIGRHLSKPALCTSGVPQGSLLGLLLFTIYTSPVSSFVQSFNIQQHQYADDTQLFIALSPTGFLSDIHNLTQCLSAIHWFCLNGMALNPDKSDAIIIGTCQQWYFQ